MTPKCSQIFRAFARGESIKPIVERSGVSYGQTWSQLRRAIAELDRHKQERHPGQHEGIISRALWERVQERLGP
jgi:Recombinase